MNTQEKFLEQIKPLYKYEVGHDILFKYLTRPHSGSELSYLINKCVENNIDVFKPIYLALKIPQMKELINYDRAKIIYTAIEELPASQSHFINYEIIKSFCSIRPKSFNRDEQVKNFLHQLKIVNKLPDEDDKFTLVKEIYYNILTTKNSAENQKRIYTHWKRIGKNVEEIKELIPTLSTENPSIELSRQEITLTKIDCNKLAKEFNIKKSENAYTAVMVLLENIITHIPDLYDYKKSDMNQNQLSIISHNPESGDKINLLINHFFLKCHKYLNSSSASTITSEAKKMVTPEELEAVVFNSKLEKTLQADRDVGRKLKI